MRREEQLRLDQLCTAAAAVFAVAVLAVYPLYIDRFSNLGVVKYTGVFTLYLLFGLVFGAFAAVGGRAPAGRLADLHGEKCLWWAAAFGGATLVSTVVSLSPLSSVFGLGGYYGGLTLALFCLLGYVCVRCFFTPDDLGLLWACLGVTSMAVTVFYVLNTFNIDPLGAYGQTVVVERSQFFSTLGQKDFNAGFMCIALPIVFWWFLEAERPRDLALRGIPAAVGAAALAVVDAEGLLLGVGAASLVLVCHKSFTTRTLRRIAFLGLMFFCGAGVLSYLRAHFYSQGGTPLLAQLGAPKYALPGAALCAALWLGLWLWRRSRGETPLWLPGRVVTAALLVGGAALFLLASFWPEFPSLGKLDNFFKFNDDWGTYRGTAWRIAFGAWWDAPLWRKLFGFGPGMMHDAVEAWAGAGYTARMQTFYAAHNEYLEQLLTTGILGLAAWVGFIVSHLRRAVGQWQRPGVAPILLALCSYLSQAVVSIRVSMVFPEVMVLFALLAVCTAAPQPVPAPAPAVKPRHGKRAAQKTPAPPAARGRAAHNGCAVVLAAAAMALCGAASRGIFWFLF